VCEVREVCVLEHVAIEHFVVRYSVNAE
jgi:hypothetical protein